MMNKLAGLVALAVLVAAAGAYGEATKADSKAPREIEILGYGIDIHGTVEGGVASRFVWRGFDLYPDKGVVQGSADVKIADTGLGASVAAHRAMGGGNEDWQRWDYGLYYGKTALKGEPIEAEYRVGWSYYNYPKWKWRYWDLQEAQASVSLPNITTVKGLVPSAMISKFWPSGDHSMVGGGASGWLYTLMLDYAFSVPVSGIIATMPEQVIKLHGEVQYDDGFSPWGAPVDSDWSDAIFGASTDFDLGYGITLTPAVYYEKVMDMSTSVDGDEREVWFSLTGRLNF